jgi:amidase
MPYFGQEIFELTAALALGADDPQPDFGGLTYNQALEIDRLSGVDGIDKALTDFRSRCGDCAHRQPGLAHRPAVRRPLPVRQFGLAAGCGLSHHQVPANLVFGIPLGVSFFGTAFSEPR